MFQRVFAALMGLGLVLTGQVALASKKVPGLDVSHYQGDVDWKAVKASGIVFAFAKAAQGASGGDSEFAKNWAGMKEAGILRGAHDFCVVADDPAGQAADFIKRVTLEPGDRAYW